MKIIRGLHKDDLHIQLNIPNKDLSIIVTIVELTNSNAIGETKNELDRLYETELAGVE
ncbi:MAG: hypothetical protein ACRD5B_02025 [Nitrososphaeraceae archaeon]